MQSTIYSYRFASEIIQHASYVDALNEITGVIDDCPLYIFPNKSSSNRRLDVVQQLLNAYFDRRFITELRWEDHPQATRIPDSDLAADYKKDFNGLRIQTEIQFGNMARWYSDIFKFQTAYSQDLIDMGLCIVPMNSLANRIDSNVTNYERCIRELPSAKLSITLPILIIGISPAPATPIINVSNSGFAGGIQAINQRGNGANKFKIVHGILNGVAIENINDDSPTGPMPSDQTESDVS